MESFSPRSARSGVLPHQPLVAEQADAQASPGGQHELQRPRQRPVHQRVLQREQQRQVQQIGPVGAGRQVAQRGDRAGSSQIRPASQADHESPDA